MQEDVPYVTSTRRGLVLVAYSKRRLMFRVQLCDWFCCARVQAASRRAAPPGLARRASSRSTTTERNGEGGKRNGMERNLLDFLTLQLRSSCSSVCSCTCQVDVRWVRLPRFWVVRHEREPDVSDHQHLLGSLQV